MKLPTNAYRRLQYVRLVLKLSTPFEHEPRTFESGAFLLYGPLIKYENAG